MGGVTSVWRRLLQMSLLCALCLAAGGQTQECAGQKGDVMFEILFEKGVIGLDYGQPGSSRHTCASVMCRERGVDVDQIEAVGIERAQQSIQCAPVHETIFRIEQYSAPGDADQTIVILTGLRIGWGDQGDFVTEPFQGVPRGMYGS